MNCYFETIIIMGTGQFAFNCAKYLRELSHLDYVYEYGSYAQSRLEILCNKMGISYKQLLDKTECDNLMYEIERSNKKTLIVSASNIYIFPKFIIENDHVKIINYHPALLTKHRGRNAEAWAIYEQDKVTGVTWHEVTSEIDRGAILAERKIELDSNITSVKLMLKQYQAGFELFKNFVGQIIEKKDIPTKTTTDYGKMHYSYEKPNDGILDLTWKRDKISAFLRSMDYGSLNVMGSPFIFSEGGRKCCWDTYKILNSIDGLEATPSIKIINKENMFFVLENYREVV